MSKKKKLERAIRKTLAKAPGSSVFPPNFGSLMSEALKDLPEELSIPVPMPSVHMENGLGKAGSPLVVKGLDGIHYRYTIKEIRDVDASNCEIILKKEET